MDHLESQVKALAEAVRVLGNSLRCEIHLLTCYRVQRRPSDSSIVAAIKATAAVNANPIAAVEGGKRED